MRHASYGIRTQRLAVPTVVPVHAHVPFVQLERNVHGIEPRHGKSVYGLTLCGLHVAYQVRVPPGAKHHGQEKRHDQGVVVCRACFPHGVLGHEVAHVPDARLPCVAVGTRRKPSR